MAGIPEGKASKDYVLKIKNNLYGGCAASRVWNRYLHDGLLKIGFTQSKIDECLYFRKNNIFMVYVDDGILAGPSADEIDEVIQLIGERYNITDEGDLTDYLGVHVTHLPDGLPPPELKNVGKPSDPNTKKIVNGVEHLWCDNHSWCSHKTCDCRKPKTGILHPENPNNKNGNGGNQPGGGNRNGRAVTPYSALLTRVGKQHQD